MAGPDRGWGLPARDAEPGRPVPGAIVEIRASKLPWVVLEPSSACSGGVGFHLVPRRDTDDGRLEIGHWHADGRVHLIGGGSMQPALVARGWAERLADGSVLVAAPRNPHELDVVWAAVLDAYQHALGR